jgi:hypothetical protein
VCAKWPGERRHIDRGVLAAQVPDSQGKVDDVEEADFCTFSLHLAREALDRSETVRRTVHGNQSPEGLAFERPPPPDD